MELRQLEQLVLFRKKGSISEVARTLYLSQPSVTASLKNLEEELGITLLERKTNRATLTEYGMRVAKLAESIVDKRDDILNLCEQLKRQENTVTVGAVSPTALLTILPILQSRFPQVTIRSEVCQERSAIDGLVSHRYDLCVVVGDPNKDVINSIPVFKEKLYLMVPKDHSLARKEKIYLKELDRMDIILFGGGGVWSEIVRKKVHGAKFIAQDDLYSYRILTQQAALPFFTTDCLLPSLSDEATLGRHKIEIMDEEAVLSYKIAMLLDAPRSIVKHAQEAAVILSNVDYFMHAD